MAEEQPSAAQASTSSRRWAPPPALTGFVLLLAAVFALSYGVGAAAGPVAPGMRPDRTGSPGDSVPHGGTDGGTDGADGAGPGGGAR
ncbi:hypothetical protein ABZZ17_22920 [Streptomyces sp. NPDC006512]|uniref:hypothetical protein n=1 Tax=Streptomyces sp. NPDC006512 TaxID=3154307 RepID=UPI0033A9E3D1